MRRMLPIGEIAVGRIGWRDVRVYLDNEEQHRCIYANAHTGLVKRWGVSTMLPVIPPGPIAEGDMLRPTPRLPKIEFIWGDVKIFGPAKIFPKEAWSYGMPGPEGIP